MTVATKAPVRVELFSDEFGLIRTKVFASPAEAESFAVEILGAEFGQGVVVLSRLSNFVDGDWVVDSEFEF